MIDTIKMKQLNMKENLNVVEKETIMDDSNISVIYHGLALTHETMKSTRSCAKLMQRVYHDILEWRQQIKHPVLVYLLSVTKKRD